MPTTTPHILMVEDSQFMATHVASTLRDTHNFHVTITQSKDEAQDLLGAYDDIVCIVTNFQLAETTGIHLAAALDSGSDEIGVPIILLTAKQLEPIAPRGLDAGVDEFVYKGDYATGNMDVLANRIDVVVRAHANPELANGYVADKD